MFDPKRLYSPDEVRDVTGIKVSTLSQWRHKGRGPAYHKFELRVAYSGRDLNEWLESNRVAPTDPGR